MGDRPPVPSTGLLDRAFSLRWRGLLATVGLGLVMLFSAVWFPAVSVRSGSATNKVQDLQRAYRVEQFASVLTAWSATDDRAVDIMKRENIGGLDLAFPAVYALAAAWLYAWLTGRRVPDRLDRVRFALPLVAAAFDYVENGLELYALRGIGRRADVERAIANHMLDAAAIFGQSACAYVKYSLLAMTAVSLAAAAVQRLVRRQVPRP